MLNEKIEVAGRHASAAIVRQVNPDHKRLVVDLCSALVEAHRANRRYHALVDNLNLGGVAWGSLHAMQPNKLLGQPNDPYSTIACYLREAVAYGFIEASIVPAELR